MKTITDVPYVIIRIIRIIRRTRTAVFLAILCMLLSSQGSANGSIHVHFSAEGHSIPIKGASFGIVKLLDYEEGRLTLTGQAEKLGLTKEEILRDTKKTAEGLQKKAAAEQIQKTGENGMVRFTGLSDGTYLILMTGRDGEAEYYKEAVPSIVTIPFWMGEELSYEQWVYPKTTKERDPSSIHESASGDPVPRTGDSTNIWIWVLLMATAGGSLIFRIIRKRKS